jgi:hypothetical protein
MVATPPYLAATPPRADFVIAQADQPTITAVDITFAASLAIAYSTIVSVASRCYTCCPHKQTQGQYSSFKV